MAWPSSYYTFDPGVDISGTFGIYATTLMTMIKDAVPNDRRGLVCYSSDTPPVTGDDAWHMRCIWLDTSTVPPTLKTYNTDSSTWVSAVTTSIAAGSITNAMLAGSIALSKLDIGTGTASQVPRVNAGETAFELVDPEDIIPTGGLGIDKITPDSAPNESLLMSFLGSMVWVPAANIVSWISPNTIATNMIISPSASTAYRFFVSDTSGVNGWSVWQNGWITDNTLPVTKLVPGTDGQALMIEGTTPKWKAPTIQKLTSEYFATGIAIPAALGITSAYPHGMGPNGPKLVKIILRCVSDDGPFVSANKDALCIENVVDDATAQYQPLHIFYDKTNIYVMRNGATGLMTLRPDTRANHTLDESKWRLEISAWS